MDGECKQSIDFTKKKHYSVKLKERIAELERDLYLILDGDVQTTTIYKTRRQFVKDREKMIWSGSPSCITNGILK